MMRYKVLQPIKTAEGIMHDGFVEVADKEVAELQKLGVIGEAESVLVPVAGVATDAPVVSGVTADTSAAPGVTADPPVAPGVATDASVVVSDAAVKTKK
jgi:hypothetical protein